MNSLNVNVVLFGAPAAGKGTQAKILAERLGVPHVASGDLFRDHQERNTELGRQAKSYMERGVLVPDQVTIKMTMERLAHSDCSNGFVLDGFPRTLDQAKALTENEITIDQVINIKVSEEELVRRISGRLVCRNCQTSYHRDFSPPKEHGRCDQCGGKLYQRDDDSPQAARRRLLVHEEVQAPVLKYYMDARKLEEVEGDASIEEVARAIEALVG